MLKVLIANKNLKKNYNYFKFLKKYNEFQIESSYTGVETIEKYKTSKPNIIILDSNISDMSYTDIIDQISMFPEEEEKCNMILTINNKKDKLLLENTSKIYKVLEMPSDTDKFESTVNSMKEKFEKSKITSYEIKFLFSRLGLPTDSAGANYMISAIFKKYYYPTEYIKLNDILYSISKEFNVPQDVVRSCLRTFLNALNNSYNIHEQKYYRDIFGYNTYITPKNFLEDFTAYLNMRKNKIEFE